METCGVGGTELMNVTQVWVIIRAGPAMQTFKNQCSTSGLKTRATKCLMCKLASTLELQRSKQKMVSYSCLELVIETNLETEETIMKRFVMNNLESSRILTCRTFHLLRATTYSQSFYSKMNLKSLCQLLLKSPRKLAWSISSKKMTNGSFWLPRNTNLPKETFLTCALRPDIQLKILKSSNCQIWRLSI